MNNNTESSLEPTSSYMEFEYRFREHRRLFGKPFLVLQVGQITYDEDHYPGAKLRLWRDARVQDFPLPDNIVLFQTGEAIDRRPQQDG